MRRLLPLLLFASFATAADKPVPTADAAAKMKLPPGFKVTLFAGEPDVVQPIAFTFDDRGRMWVVECLTYPKWSQDGKGGKDRVIILEDTDGDGKHDKKTVVLDDGVNLSGIELGFDGVYLCSSPNLIFIPIKDDKPAGKPEVLLDGWNIKDAKHNVFNSLIWGPDGWLYGCNGIQTKSKVGKPGTPDKDRVLFDCGVWRFHPTRKVFEVVATGTTNPWGLDFDEHGEMFITNCVIDHLFHVVPGGRYTRMYGQDYNPHTYGYMGSAVDYKHWGGGHWTESRANQKTGEVKKEHDDAGGGHAHAGAAIYLGDNFPKEYRNTLFTANIHGNRLNNDGLEPTKTGMKGVRRPDFLFANDPWFRGICVKQGPAGELFVSDWCDTGECHNYDVADTTNGRIYRVTYGDLKPWTQDVNEMTSKALAEGVFSTNEWFARRCRLKLQERATAGAFATNITRQQLSPITTNQRNFKDAEKMIRANRVMFSMGLADTDDYRNMCGASGDTFLWGVRMGTAEGRVDRLVRKSISSRCKGSNPLDRSAVAAAMRTLPAEARLDIAAELFANETDNAFDNLTWQYWYAIQPAVLERPAEALKLVNAIAIEKVRTNIVRLFLTLPESDIQKQFDEVMATLTAAPDAKAKRDILRGIRDVLTDRRGVKPPKGWEAEYKQLAASDRPEARQLADDLGVMMDDPVAIAALRTRALTTGTAERERAIALLASRKTAEFDVDLRKLLADPAVRAAAIRGLANYADDKTPAVLLELYPKLTPDEKADAVQTLSCRAAYASALLDAVAKGTVPKGDITAFTARQIAGLKDKAVADKLAKVWGEVKTGTANAKAKIAEYKNKLTPDVLAKGDITKGKVLFTKTCGVCHKLFGEGQTVGPELTGSQRGNLDYLLENVVDPNAVVPFDYKMTQFYLKDGRQISGLVKGETPQTVTVRTVNEEVVLSKADIDERKGTNNSVMPEGLFDALKPDELRDLLKYLMSKDGK